MPLAVEARLALARVERVSVAGSDEVDDAAVARVGREEVVEEAREEAREAAEGVGAVRVVLFRRRAEQFAGRSEPAILISLSLSHLDDLVVDGPLAAAFDPALVGRTVGVLG